MPSNNRLFRRTYPQIVSLLIVCLLLSIALGAKYEARTTRSADPITSRFDRWITWNDGSVEHVQIGIDGFFILNGTQRRLVGFDLGTTGLQRAFWDPADLSIIEKELAYLQSVGVRFVTLDLYYVGSNNEQSRFSPILNLLRSYKMLVLPVITGKPEPKFGNLTVLDFPISGKYGDDTMGNWTLRWVDVIKNYSNVVAISAENELDCPELDQCYSVEQVSVYLSWLKGIIRSITTLPITSKLCYTTWSNLDIKRAVLAEVDFPAADAYAFNATDHEYRLNRWTTFLTENNKSANGWWIGEENKYMPSGGFDTSNFTVEYIEKSFNYGASVVCLWTMNRNQNSSAAFFNAYGDPVRTLLDIAPHLSSLQSQLPQTGVTVFMS